VSALEEYRKFEVVVRFGSHVGRQDVDAVAEGVRLLQGKADAAIAELEAALADIDRAVGILRFTIDGLRAALAERDARRCEMCGHWGKHEMWPDQGWCPQHNEMDADCSCSEWTARAEEGSRNE